MQKTSFILFFYPFKSYSVRLVQSLEDFKKVAKCRYSGYSQRYSHFQLNELPDNYDEAPSSLIFLVEHKQSKEVVGTFRVRHSLNGRDAGNFEKDGFPDELFDEPFITIERFSVTATKHRLLVKTVLFSSLLKISDDLKINKFYAYATPSLQKVYEKAYGFNVDSRQITLNSALTNFKDQKLLVATRASMTKAKYIPFLTKVLKYYSSRYFKKKIPLKNEWA